MATSMQKSVSALLIDWAKGDPEAFNKAAPILYKELRRIAKNYFRRERLDHTLQCTALVHEAYLRLAENRPIRWQSRAHFYAVAARMMRQILVDHARRRGRAKRGGLQQRLPLNDALDLTAPRASLDLLTLDAALDELARLDAQQSRIVELRYFGGLTIAETSEALGVSHATVERDWALARAWLFQRLRSE